ncbi:MAG TPA: hypothetical protein DIW47_12420 [Bacteroidetes bacterium]|nr:hypothetical protein [Bacteroidota bacterium]
MKQVLLCFLLSLTSLLSADSLDIVFRYYDGDGRVVSSPLVMDGGTQLGKTDEGGWQHWRMLYQEGMVGMTIKNEFQRQTLTIQVHPDWQNTLKTLVINRIQASGEALLLKVNHLTCRWTAGIAYPIEYRFNNPIDGQELKLQSWSCAKDQDSLKVSIHILSDSVMLYSCGKSEAILAKYYLGSDGQVFRSFAPSECHEFSTNAERELYLLLKDSSMEIRYSWDGSRFVLGDAKGCRWEFSF